MASTLTLIANPGSASRKYALFDGEHERASLHFEWLQGRVICTLQKDGEQHVVQGYADTLAAAAGRLTDIFSAHDVLKPNERIEKIGLRVVAPSAYFLEDHVVDDEFLTNLQAVKPRAPIHISATLEELQILITLFNETSIVGISDSAFHATKPDYAWNYGISLELADRFDIKRFGYHGISVASVVRELQGRDKLPPKLIVCHLGSGASVTAVHKGKSIDNTMGYSPLEGVVMSTRSGSIDPTVVRALKDVCHFDDDGVEDYLNNHSGLLGLGGSSDIRELLRREEDGDHQSHLALETYIYSIQKAVGQMSAALGGLDALVFTGTVGERSSAIRGRVIARLHYFDLIADDATNTACNGSQTTIISRLAHSKPIFVVPTQEAAEMNRRAQLL